VYECDADFGALTVIDPPLFAVVEPLPSEKIQPEKLAYLNTQ
jgi:hypothetical protein